MAKVIRSRTRSTTKRSTRKRSVTKRSTRKRSVTKRSMNSRKKVVGRCEPSTLKKYINRKGPPYPAQNCRNHKKTGNDGELYESIPDYMGVYSWKKV